MQEVKQFVADVQNLATTRKFWVSIVGVVANAVAIYLAEQPELVPVFSLLSAVGVYRVPNGE